MDDELDRHENTPVITLIGGPTALIEFGGLRLLTDPTFDGPGEYGGGRLRKLTGPALSVGDVERVDAVLLSHDQHADNLDVSGRALLAAVPLVLTTAAGARRLGGSARGLAPWHTVEIDRPDGSRLRITGTPAQHGPDDVDRGSDGDVIGFLLSGDDLPTVYVSGDNASTAVVAEIARWVGPVDVAVLFAGAARVADVAGGAPLTLTSTDAAAATGVLGAQHMVPVHVDGWAHLSQGLAEVRSAFDAAGLADRLVTVVPGEPCAVLGGRGARECKRSGVAHA